MWRALCDDWATYLAEFSLSDVVISDEHRFVFVDNVKAASSSIRSLFERDMNLTWATGCDGRRVRSYQLQPLHNGHTTAALASQKSRRGASQRVARKASEAQCAH